MSSLRKTVLGGAALALLAALALTGCSDDSGGEPEASTSLPRVRLMTGDQYKAALTYLFGQDVADSVVAPLPPMPRTDGLLQSGASSIGVTSDQLSQVQTAAATIAAKVVDEKHRDYLISCAPEDAKAADHACAEEFLKATGRLWFRRPLPEGSLARYVETADAAARKLEDFYAGLGVALEGMLVSPEALFIVDRVEPDPDRPGVFRLDAYSLASRLSFFLWNAPPDDELLDAAESGELTTPEGRARVVDAMLASPRLEHGVRAFFDDMLNFNDFDSLSKDSKVYPAVTGATLADAREQTLRTIYDQLVVKHGDYRDLFTSRETFMSPNLAVAYGVPTTRGWEPYTFPEDSPRQGLLTQISFLTAHAHPARSSVTRRGRALRELFLCQIVPDPPPNVDFSNLEDPDPSLKTAKQRLAVHASNPSCAGCHKIMDPIGLSLEHFDGGGQFRATENGATLDTSGEIDGAQFQDIEGLNAALHDHPALPSCLVKRVYAYGTGGPLAGRRDWPELHYLEDQFAEAGYRLPELLKTIALSQAFSEVRMPREKEPAGKGETLANASPDDAHQATNGG